MLILIPLINRYNFLGKFLTPLQFIARHLTTFLAALDTCIHELAHALAAFVCGWKVSSIEINKNLSGVASYSKAMDETKLLYKVQRFFITFVGYPTPVFISILCFILIDKNYAFFVLVGLASIILFALLFLIRNRYGALWALGFLVVLTIMGTHENPNVHEVAALIVTMYLFIGSLFHIISIVKFSFSNVEDTIQDTSILENFTSIPRQFWAVIYILIALFGIFLCIKLFI